MCFYFLFNLGETNKRVGGKNQCLPPLIITLVFRVGLYWKSQSVGYKKWETIVSHQALIPPHNTWLCSLKLWKSLIHSVSLPPTLELILTSPRVSAHACATLFGRQRTSLLSTECKNSTTNCITTTIFLYCLQFVM